MQAQYYLYAGSLVGDTHLLHPGDLEQVFAVLLSALLSSTSLPADLNFLPIFPWNEIYITEVSLCAVLTDLF